MTKSAAQILALLQGLLTEVEFVPGVDFTDVSVPGFTPDNADFVLTMPNGQTFKISAEEL